MKTTKRETDLQTKVSLKLLSTNYFSLPATVNCKKQPVFKLDKVLNVGNTLNGGIKEMITNTVGANVVETKTKLAYSVAEAADVVSMSKSYLRNEIRVKKLRAKLVGNRVLILNSDLQTWLEGKGDWQGINERIS